MKFVFMIILSILMLPCFVIGILYSTVKFGFSAGYECMENYLDNCVEHIKHD